MSQSHRDGVDVVTSLAGVEALASEWDILAESIGLPMLSHAWVLACASTLYREDELQVITVRVRGALAGVAPLVARDRAGVKRLELIGSSYLGEPSGLLHDSDEALHELVPAILNASRPVVLSRIPEHSPVIARWRSVARGRGLVAAGPVAGTVGVPIESGWEAYLARLSSRRRYDLRRARRRAGEAGKVVVRIHSPRPEQVEGMFAELVRIEAAGWKDRSGSSLRQRHHLRQFFRHYAALASRSGILRFSFLDVDGKAIAAQLSVEYAKRLWVLKIGYDEAWSRCSPGLQLLAETMRYAFEQKLDSYEFLGSDESWLHGWETERSDLSSLAWYPATLSGAWALATDSIGRLGARLVSIARRR
jgi:CelD/BcsL family acetyltransferase involved in cellulose biosynthesis